MDIHLGEFYLKSKVYLYVLWPKLGLLKIVDMIWIWHILSYM